MSLHPCAARSARRWPFGTFDGSDNYRSEARTMPA